jgi:hypothetical protein
MTAAEQQRRQCQVGWVDFVPLQAVTRRLTERVVGVVPADVLLAGVVERQQWWRWLCQQ